MVYLIQLMMYFSHLKARKCVCVSVCVCVCVCVTRYTTWQLGHAKTKAVESRVAVLSTRLSVMEIFSFPVKTVNPLTAERLKL